MLALHCGSRVVSFLPQVPRRRHDSLGNAALLPANPAILSPPGCQKCALPLVRPVRKALPGTNRRGSILALASRFSRPFLRKLAANDLLQMLVCSGVLDLTVAFEIETGTVTNVKSAG